MNIAVIVAAAGRGQRFGGMRNKIFERLGGRPVFLRTLELFVNREDVCQTVLVVHQEDTAEMSEKYGGNLGFMGVKIVTGGATRTESIRKGLSALTEEADFVAIHDAVRPCVSPLWLDDVFAAAAKAGAAILANPVHGTLKRAVVSSEDDDEPTLTIGGEPIRAKGSRKREIVTIEKTVPREELWEAQTPQVFRRDLIERAYALAGEEPATDDAQLVERLGAPVRIVAGDPRNVKITRPADLAMAAAVIESLPKPKPKSDGRGPFAEDAMW